MVFDPKKKTHSTPLQRKYFPIRFDKKTIEAHNRLVNNDLDIKEFDKSKKNTNNYFKKK